MAVINDAVLLASRERVFSKGISNLHNRISTLAIILCIYAKRLPTVTEKERERDSFPCKKLLIVNPTNNFPAVGKAPLNVGESHVLRECKAGSMLNKNRRITRWEQRGTASRLRKAHK